MSNPILETRNLKKYFPVAAGAFGSKSHLVHAVDNVNMAIMEKETFALVGESGCGKTTLGRLLLRLVEPTAGEALFKGKNIFDLEQKEMRLLRRNMQIIFQDPYASLDPRMRIRDIIAEPLRTHSEGQTSKEMDARVQELISIVGLRSGDLMKFPHQFSGGQRQRIGIARALALQPQFIVCDEAVSALDVSIQAQILNLLQDLQERFKLTLLFITHDLSVVRHMADRVGVMFLGKCVEMGRNSDIFEKPLHPYTRFLLSAVPLPDPNKKGRKKMILKGDIPSPINLPSGCRFHTRCPFSKTVCEEEDPPTRTWNGRNFACHFPLE